MKLKYNFVISLNCTNNSEPDIAQDLAINKLVQNLCWAIPFGQLIRLSYG